MKSPGRAVWGLLAVQTFLLLIASLGCTPWFTRTVYVPHGTAVRLRETLYDVKIWARDETGTPVPGTMDLPEGWYALPDPGEGTDGGH